MALRFLEPGGRIYGAVGASNVNLLQYWTAASSGLSVQSGLGRLGGSCLRISNWNVQYIYKAFGTPIQTIGVALAFRVNSDFPNGGPFVSFFDSGTHQMDLRVNSGGLLYVTRGGTTLATSTVGLSLNTFYHIEYKVKIDPTVGTVEVRLNGIPVIGPLTGLNTRNTTNSFVNSFYLGTFTSGTGGTHDYDDVIVWDTVPTDANGYPDINDWVGDCRVDCLFPNAVGASAQWIPDTAVANYIKVGETTLDNATYVESATVGHIDSYNLSDLPANAVLVKGVAAVVNARKTDSGSRGIKTVLRSGGGYTIHSNELFLPDGFVYNFASFGQNPNNGSPIPWTIAGVNALEVGQIVSS